MDVTNSILVMGLSHKTAPVEIREKLTIPKNKLLESLDRLKQSGSIEEAVILSTCNRLEVYARPIDDHSSCSQKLKSFFQSLYDVPHVSQSLYQAESRHAIHHLFRVASGLDSMVVGETDVLGQVKAAYLTAKEEGYTGKITNVLFQRALFVGKTIRTKTNISEGLTSVGSVAVRLAEKIFGSLAEHSVLIIGAGKMAKVTARHLMSQKANHIVVINRTQSKAESMARLLNGRASQFDQIESEIMKADIVICSAGVDSAIVTKNMVEKIIVKRQYRSLYFVDIGVPRNVEPAAHDLDNVYVYNIDDLKSLVEESLNQRRGEIEAAALMVDTMANESAEWLAAALRGDNRPLRHAHHSMNDQG